jgi:hypothetical protein
MMRLVVVLLLVSKWASPKSTLGPIMFSTYLGEARQYEEVTTIDPKRRKDADPTVEELVLP